MAQTLTNIEKDPGRKRVFWISGNDLRSAGSGGAVYSQSVLRLLLAARPAWDVQVFSPTGADRPKGPAWHRLRQVSSVLKSAFGGWPSKVLFSDYSSLGAEIAKASAPDLIILDGADAMVLADPLIRNGVEYLLVVHNMEAKLFADRVSRMTWPGKLVMALLGEPDRYRRFEENVWAGASGLLHISIDEMTEVRTNAPAIFVPPTFPANHAQNARGPGPIRVGYVGKLTWWPNRQGLEWFIKDIWPTRETTSELHLWGLGSEIFDAPEDGVFGHGFADSIEEVWRSCDIVLVPTLSGGGVNIKLCEALANGKPVLATPKALRGLPVLDDPAVRVCRSPDDWAKALTVAALKDLAAHHPEPDTQALFIADNVRPKLEEWLANFGI